MATIRIGDAVVPQAGNEESLPGILAPFISKVEDQSLIHRPAKKPTPQSSVNFAGERVLVQKVYDGKAGIVSHNPVIVPRFQALRVGELITDPQTTKVVKILVLDHFPGKPLFVETESGSLYYIQKA